MQDKQVKASGELVKQVAKRCYISSEDELIQDRLLSIVNNAIFNVKSLLGISDDNYNFSTSSMENELFLNYCMYRWNNRSQKEFESNYMGDIIAIRSKNEVEYNKKLKQSNEESEDEG